MQTEILFRGMCLTDLSWQYGDYHHNRLGFSFILAKDALEFGGTKTSVRPSSVGQFIGKTDTDGIQIFGGDFLRFVYEDLFETYTIIGLVEWSDDNCGWWLNCGDTSIAMWNDNIDTDLWEVVGNETQHENMFEKLGRVEPKKRILAEDMEFSDRHTE